MKVSGEYVGVLRPDTPLYAFLSDEVLGRVLCLNNSRPIFDVYRLDKDIHRKRPVLRYAVRHTCLNLVGKFYADGTGDPHPAAQRLRREYDHLRRLRALGLDAPPHQVVRPLSIYEGANCVLVEEFVAGQSLTFYVRRALHEGEGDQLFERLAQVARFLADLHSRGQVQGVVEGKHVLTNLDGLVRQLAHQHVISFEQRQRLARLHDRWAVSHMLDTGRQVWIHGDAKPKHFILSGEGGVTAIDLEGLQNGDRAADLGRLAAALKLEFFRHTGDLGGSEPYIQHLYASYADCLPTGAEDCAALATRSRFYVACYQLRRGRYAWLDLGDRRRLINDAEACLQV